MKITIKNYDEKNTNAMTTIKLFIVTLILFSSCTSPSNIAQPFSFEVQVDAINTPNSSKKIKYKLFSGIKNINENNLQYQEYALYVHRALKSKGYVKTLSSQKADITVYLRYGINDGKTLRSFSSSSSVTAYGVTNSHANTVSSTDYFRHMSLEAIELKNTKEKIQLWKITATSTGSSNDLRRIFPILIGASKDYIGYNTKGKINTQITEDDDKVLEIKGIDIAEFKQKKLAKEKEKKEKEKERKKREIESIFFMIGS